MDFSDNDIPQLKVALVNASKTLLDTKYSAEFQEEENKSLLDLINLLYVVLTRPEDRLYIFTSQPPKKSDGSESVPKLLKRFLDANELWDDNKSGYSFGKKTKNIRADTESGQNFTLDRFISNPWQNRMLISLQAPEHWNIDDPEEKQQWGNLIHLILSEIKTIQDVKPVIEKFNLDGVITDNEKNEIQDSIMSFLSHPAVEVYFQEGLHIKTEPEILLANGKSVRPDRLVIKDEGVTVIDFKTGKLEEKHRDQVKYYLSVMKEMGYKADKGVLLYFGEDDPVVEVN